MRVVAGILSATLVCMLGFSNGKSPVWENSIAISVESKPGEIISILMTEGKSSKSRILLPPRHDKIHDHISLSDDGVFTLKSNVSHLVGKTFPLTIQHETPTRQWKQEIHVQFHKTSPRMAFSAAQYTGSLPENKPPGTRALGLREFDNSVQSFSSDCVFTINKGDVDAFKIVKASNTVTLVSGAVFDREAKDLYSFVVKAECSGGLKAFTRVVVMVTDVDDNAPQFVKSLYNVNLATSDLIQNKEILQVEASDKDLNDESLYSLSSNKVLNVHPTEGQITLVHPQMLTQSYQVLAFVQDQAGNTGAPATIHVTIDNSPMVIFEEWDLSIVHHVQKRQTQRDGRSFVVMDNIYGDLFSVAPIPPIEGERYYFVDPAPENLTLDSVLGMVSRENNHIWNSEMESFTVNFTHSEGSGEMEVTVYTESGVNWEAPILTNEPFPLKARVPIWIRPYTTIFTARARIVEQYGVDVHYKIESGGEGRFYIEPMTGEVKIRDRGEFEEGYLYYLAISAQTVGNARRMDTPAQLLTVQVEDIHPQFKLDPYVINVKETSRSGQVVDTIVAKSFQELPVRYSWTFNTPSDGSLFSLNRDKGEVTLERQMVFIDQERAQFRGEVTVSEQYSGFSTTVDLIINLVPENLHTPFFPAEHYVKTGVSEDVAIGFPVLDVLAVDLDPYDLGYLDFTVNDPRFKIVSSDGKTGVLQTAAALDYDTAGPEHKYEFTIVATDRDPVSPKSGTATVQVYLENVEDEAPVFFPAEQEVFVTELTQPTLEFVYFVQAYDPDHPDNGQLSFSFVIEGDCQSGTSIDCDIFSLEQNTGRLSLRQQVPLGKENIVLPISASDGTESSQSQVKVNFVGVNHPPTFPQCNQYRDTAVIQEGMAVGTSIINITAVDDDSGINGQLVFSLVGDHRYDQYFALKQLNNNQAELVNDRKFDREDPEDGVVTIGGEILYRVTVLAEDEGNPTLSATCFFFVTIGDVNDNPPRFIDGIYDVHIPMDMQLNQEFLHILAIDDDQGSVVTYSIVTQPNDCTGGQPCFAIDPNTGWLKIDQAIPTTLSIVKLTVRATDNELYSDVTVTVHFESDEQNLPPNWERVNGVRIDDLTGITVNETVPQGTRVDVFLKAVLPGLEGDVTYLLTRGRTDQENAQRDFTNEDNDAQQAMDVIVAQNLKYERVSRYMLKLRASRLSSTDAYADAILHVDVIDQNNEIPEFQGLDKTGKYPAAVSDQTREGDVVLTVIAIDLDGVSPNNKVTYHWGPSCPDCTDFRLDEDTGEILATQQYDRAAKKEYRLRVVAQDGAPSAIRRDKEPNRATIDVAVLVLGPSQASPRFYLPRYEITINEGEALFSAITNLTAMDPDPEFNYPQYLISGGNERHLFAVDPSNGTIYNTGYLQFREQQAFVLIYNVFDGRNIASTLLVINITSVNVHPPWFTQDVYENTDVMEDTTITTDFFLASASASDPDDSRPRDVKYSIQGVLTQQNKFRINDDGDIFLVQPGNLDRDYPDGYSNWQFNLVAEDEGSTTEAKKGYAVMNVLLEDRNDHAPVFDPCCFEGSVPEHSGAGTFVMQLVANDADAGDNGRVNYELLSGPALFAVSGSGQVTVSNQPGSLDREDVDKYELVVRARDNGNPHTYSAENQTIYITVTDVNDNRPQFVDPPYSVSVPEEIPVGGSVAAIQGLDLDIGENSKLTFSIDSGNDNGHFYFDNIYVAEIGVLKIAKPIDYDGSPGGRTFRLGISMSDPLSDADNNPTTLDISVYDINDNPPIFTPSFIRREFDEDEEVGFSVATFTASDPDTGAGGIFSFSIDYENTDREKKFAINPTTGVVTTRNLLDREQQSSYMVHILATDQGSPPQTGTATLEVTLNDLNDHAPDFPPFLTPITVRSTTQEGQEVATFTAIDMDSPQNGPPFTFEYNCNDVQCEDFSFEFDPNRDNGTGIVRARVTNYNRYTQNRKFYSLGIRMTDNPTSGQPSLSATRILTVHIESLNDRRMSQDGSVKSVDVYNYEGKFDNVPCGSVYVNDQDDDDLDDKSFSCTEGCSEQVEDRFYEYFRVAEDSGEVTMKAGTPKGAHKVEVRVYDRKWDQTITATLNINVIYIYGDAVLSSGSMRLEGVTLDEFLGAAISGASLVRKSESPSKLEKFRTKLASLLGVDEANVDVFSVLEVPGEEGMVDVQFAAHGSPYYSPARMNGLVLANKAEIESDVGVTVAMSPVDLCFVESCFSGGCDSRVVTHSEPALVNTNTASFVGVNTTYDFVCECPSQTYTDEPPVCDAYSCYNGGTCLQNWNGFSCQCAPGFEGPRCQSTHVSLDGNSWAWYDTLGTSQCSDSRLSFDFITTQPSGLLLYNGPLAEPSDRMNVPDFLAIWLDGGFVNARVNLGDAEVDLVVSAANGASPLNNGEWHTVEFIKQQRTLRLVVDHCLVSTITENVNETDEDRGRCESRVEYPGEMFLLNVLSPLELGGRSNPNYPPNLPTAGFNGCIKGLMHGDYLYDLTVSRTETGGSPSNTCTREGGCVPSDACPVNSTCTGNFNNNNKQCVCDSGWMGADCSTETPVKDIKTDEGFIEWKLKEVFNRTLSSRAVSIQIQYRSRQPDGILFTASSFSRLEHLKLDLVTNNLRLRYDLGSDERDLWLSYVNASDGLWHVVTITRYGNQVILKMDHGEGKYYNESLPQDEHHQLMFMHDTRQTFGGAEVYYRKYLPEPVVTDVLVASCVTDVRVNNFLFPLGSAETEAAVVLEAPHTDDTCESNACGGVSCPPSQVCVDRWRMPFCVCPAGMEVLDGVCFAVTDCSVPRCENGYCVVTNGNWRCVCDEGWFGTKCDKEGTVLPPGPSVGISDTAIALIIVGVLVVILLVLLAVYLVLRKRQKDPLLVDPDDDVRENIVYYDEEGAGEEDMHAYDLSRLQKPMGPGDGPALMTAGKPTDAAPYREMPLTGAPEPMHDPRMPFQPGENPDVGDFIGGRLDDADKDPNAPPYDSVREYEYEGGGSSAGSLSSIQTSSSGDLDFDYLNDLGPNFQKLADMYGAGRGEEED